MKKYLILLLSIVFCIISCRKKDTNMNYSEKNSENQNYTEDVFEGEQEFPFVVEITGSGFFRDKYYGTKYDMNETYCYEIEGIITNNTGTPIVNAALQIKTGTKISDWGNKYDVYNYPKIEIRLQNKILSGEDDFGGYMKNKVSKDNIWRQNESREFSTKIELYELGAAHFEYALRACTINIPFSAEDATGYTYTTYFKYDITDDWCRYAKSLRQQE